MSETDQYDVLIIGAGIMGLCTAAELASTTELSIALIDQFPSGHDAGSSHGDARITRATYHSPVYVDLIEAANREDWPRLERDLGEPLQFGCGGLFAGTSGGPWDSFTETMKSCSDHVDTIGIDVALERFPQFRIPESCTVFHDRTAGVIYAARTMKLLESLCRSRGVDVLRNDRVEKLSLAENLTAEVSGRTILADRVVVTAGAWTDRLLPDMRNRYVILRQTVAHFRLDTRRDLLSPRHFPVWMLVGQEANDYFYGTPEVSSGGGIKIGRHRTVGESDDLERSNANHEIDTEQELEALRTVADRLFHAPVETLLHCETCLYSTTPTEDFILGPLPSDPRVVIGAGFSGHGFKFGPTVGRILAQLVTEGSCREPAFLRHQDRFRP